MRFFGRLGTFLLDGLREMASRYPRSSELFKSFSVVSGQRRHSDRLEEQPIPWLEFEGDIQKLCHFLTILLLNRAVNTIDSTVEQQQ
jgi:hypothetical protein